MPERASGRTPPFSALAICGLTVGLALASPTHGARAQTAAPARACTTDSVQLPANAPDSARRAAFDSRGRQAYAAHAATAAMRWFDCAARVGADHPMSLERATPLLNLAAAARAADQLDVADAAAREAVSILEVAHDGRRLASAWNSYSMIRLSLGFPDQAARGFDTALALARAAGDSGRQSTILNNIGLVADDAAQDGRGEAGLAAAHRAVTAYAASLALLAPKDTAFRAQTLVNLGVALRRIALAGGGAAYFHSADSVYALAESIQVARGDRLANARLRHNQALLLRDRGEHERAARGLLAALRVLDSLDDGWWSAVTLRELADTYRAMGRAYRSTALAYYDSSSLAFARLSERTGRDAQRAAYADQKQTIALYDHWILATLGEVAGGAATSSRVACATFAVAERGRAQALRAMMSAAMPRTLALRGGGRGGARECASNSRATLAYFATAETLLVWLTDGRGDARVVPVPIERDSLQSLIGRVRSALGVDDASVSRGSGRKKGKLAPARVADRALAALSEVLLPAGVRERLPITGDLLIIPHGSIALVPFATLPRSTRDARRLGASLALAYAPSEEVERLASERVVTAGLPELVSDALVAGDPVMPSVLDDEGQAVTLDPLKGAHGETIAIARRLHVPPLVGSAATERAVRRAMPTARIVHLASHGLAYTSDARAGESFIALAPDAASSGMSDPAGDGRLTVNEILSDSTLALRAELVVLSACETGLGRMRQSEGTLGLQRAFLARGARSVLVSLWRVDDRATRTLMERFYFHWLEEKKGKAESLRLAQRDVRAAGFAAPRDWAAFQLVGAS